MRTPESVRLQHMQQSAADVSTKGLKKSLYDFTGTIFIVGELTSTSTTMRSRTRGFDVVIAVPQSLRIARFHFPCFPALKYALCLRSRSPSTSKLAIRTTLQSNPPIHAQLETRSGGSMWLCSCFSKTIGSGCVHLCTVPEVLNKGTH